MRLPRPRCQQQPAGFERERVHSKLIIHAAAVTDNRQPTTKTTPHTATHRYSAMEAPPSSSGAIHCTRTPPLLTPQLGTEGAPGHAAGVAAVATALHAPHPQLLAAHTLNR